MDQAASYVVEIKNEETENAILADIPQSMTTFIPPADWLVADTEYQVAITVVTDTGNKTSVESAFYTEAE